MGSIVGHRIDGAGVLREASGTYPAKINPSTPHPPPPARDSSLLRKSAINHIKILESLGYQHPRIKSS